jgi:serine/threonine-protein kinase
MVDDEELFRARVTLLGLARTLAPDHTIRATSFSDTVAAPSSEHALPHISIDLAKELSSREAAAKSPDLAIVRTIGEGGMGRVHLARQRSLDRDVAVKTLKENASPAATAGLFREARLTGALEHPGVIPVHALGVDERGGPLLVMKRVEGVDWATLLAEPEHPLWAILTANVDRLAANLGILTHVCRTIEFAHSRGILHRDIKPENVMVGGYGEVYLVDWGIATALHAPSSTDGISGTPAYMAPEMFLGGALDARTDVYLLGATLHEVLTGRARHEGRDVMQVLHAALASKPVAYDASVPEQLGALCNAATARDPAARPKDARAFRDQLAEFLQRRSAMALSDAASERLSLLKKLLGGANPDELPADLAKAYRLATEARFGFVQSLREHPTHAAAVSGLRESILALVELEIRQKHADTAEALLREVDAPDPSLSARIAAVRAHDETRRREAARLEKIDRDLDPMVQAAPRAMLVGLLIVLTGTITVVAMRTSSGALTSGRLVIFGGAFAIAVTLGTFAFRRRLLTNAFNRKLTGVMLAVSFLIELQRIVDYASGAPVAHTFATDLWIVGFGVAASAITLRGRLWVGAVPSLVGAAVITRFPEHAASTFSAATVLTFVLLGLALWPSRARQSPP